MSKTGRETGFGSLDFSHAVHTCPEAFEVIGMPNYKLLDEGSVEDGSRVQLEVSTEFKVTVYQWSFELLRSILYKVGFRHIRRRALFLDAIALEAYTERELELIKKSELLMFVEAERCRNGV